MKLLKWTDSIKETVSSKEDILNKAEKAEMVLLFTTGLWGAGILLGTVLGLLASIDTNTFWLSLVLVIGSSAGFLEATIKSFLKLERYKAAWDKIDSMENELRKMQAEDL